MASSKRPGFLPVTQLSEDVRTVLEPLADVLMRMTGVSGATLVQLNTFDAAALDPASATTADIAARANDLQTALNDTIRKVNEVISRLQED